MFPITPKEIIKGGNILFTRSAELKSWIVTFIKSVIFCCILLKNIVWYKLTYNCLFNKVLFA